MDSRSPDDSTAKEPPDAWQLAIQLLERRDYSRRALIDKLVARGAIPQAAADAAHRAVELGYVDDERLARGIVRTRAELSRWGVHRIRLDLRKRGVDEEVAEQAIAWHEAQVQADCDRQGVEDTGWAGAAEQALRKRFGAWTTLEPKEKQRRIAFLVRRGFAYDQARAALDATRQTD